jgi:maleate isomerase
MIGQPAETITAPLRVGVLTPHAAPGAEVEIPEMTSFAGLDVVVARTSRKGHSTAMRPRQSSTVAHLRTLATPSALHQAVARLRQASVDVIAYASTTSGYAIGHAADVDLTGRLSQMAGVPVVSSGLAATQALKALVHRVALIHPPWFEEAFTDLAAAYFRDQGIETVTLTATPLPKDPERVRPGHVIDWVSRHVDPSTEAIFIAGNGFRAARAIEEIERRTGQPVLEANQVLLWSILTTTGTTLNVQGYGRLFR